MSIRKEKKAARRLRLERLEGRLALTVVINEFVADNENGITDQAGERHDWIELTNTGAETVDVSGWYLTDESANLAKWQLPVTAETEALDPGERLLVFASGNDGVFSDELHTNFELAAAGEFLALVEPDGTTVADMFDPYPALPPDVSYGRGGDSTARNMETLIGSGAPATYRPFDGPNQAVDDHWLEIDYNDAAWDTATNGLGFGYTAPWQSSTVSLDGESSAYARIPFSVADRAQLVSMDLELRVDNGYILFLNGREVRRERIATDFKIGCDWELNSRQNLSDDIILNEPAVFDLTPWLDVIEEGPNVLAIYAANHTSDTSDFLVHAELTAERATGAVANVFMPTPTPGTTNGAGYLGILDDTNFSHDRGFYDADFPLVISTIEPDTTIRYTTDGSLPTLAHGTTYAAPIDIHPDNFPDTVGVVTIRAAAFKPGYLPTNVDTQTYVFLDEVLGQQIDTEENPLDVPSYAEWGVGGEPDWDVDSSIVNAVGAAQLRSDLQAIPTMSLVMNWQELFGIASVEGEDGEDDIDPVHGIYTETATWHDKSDERAASLEFFTSDLAEEFQIDTTVEIQGHSSARRWNSDKLSFQVKFKAPYDRRLDSDSLFANSAVDGANAATRFDTLILDAQYNYTWIHGNPVQHEVAKYINDQVVSDFTNLAGGRAPHGRWVHLYINGLYWGIYNAHERPDDSFAAEYYGGDEDDYYAVKASDGIVTTHGEDDAEVHPEYLYVDGGLAAEAAYAALLNEVDDNLSSDTQYQQVADILDIDDFIDYMIIHYYAGNYDWGQDNWYATFNHSEPGSQWHFHTWDQEHAWPTDDNQPQGDNRDEDYDHTGFDEDDHASGPTGIHHQLMASAEYQLRFSDRVEELMRNEGLLTPTFAAAVFQARIDELTSAINGEAARWGDNRGNETGADWLANVNGVLTDFFPVRTANVIDHFDNRGWLVSLAAPLLGQNGGQITPGFLLTIDKPNGSPGSAEIYYTLDGTDPRLPGGELSTSALLYDNAIELTDSTQVQARIRNGAQWSAVVEKTFLVADNLPLRIVEINYHPDTVEEHEFIELLNTGDATINLDGVRIGGFSAEGFTFADGLTLVAGARIVVARNPVEFQQRYGNEVNLAPIGYAGANLSNGGETVTLTGPFGQLLQSFTYSDSDPWPMAADGDGPSLEYIGPLDQDAADPNDVAGDPYDNATNWRASLDVGGSPGTDGEPDTPMLAGDYDGSGTVDEADYLKWRSQYGTTVAPGTESDGNGNGLVEAGDYIVWRNNEGAMLLDPAAGAAIEAVATTATWVADGIDEPTENRSVVNERLADFIFHELGHLSPRMGELRGNHVRSAVARSVDPLLVLLARASDDDRAELLVDENSAPADTDGDLSATLPTVVACAVKSPLFTWNGTAGLGRRLGSW